MEYERTTRNEVTSLLSALVAIDSVNPSLVPAASGEGAIAQFVATWLRGNGVEVDVTDVCPGRPNVMGRVPGTAQGRSLLLNAHLDTVGVSGMVRPFEPRVEGDRLYGRGAYDMKAGLAAIMLTGKNIAGLGGAAGDLLIAAVMDEEYASQGTQEVLRTTRTDAAVVTEPTGLRLCLAHKGFAWLTVETRGRAAHGSKPELGIDAIAHMGRVLNELEQLGKRLAGNPKHPLLGTGSIHASLIQGGQELSSYPDRCQLRIERRTIPGETPDSVAGEIQTMLDDLAVVDSTFSANCSLDVWRDPFEVDVDESVVRCLQHAAVEVNGFDPELYGDTPWMDAALLSAAHIPTVIFGPGGGGAHATSEYASLTEVERCVEVLTRLTLEFCGTRPSDEGGLH